MKLDPQIENQILAAIRAGGFPHVAAEAFGVTKEKFEKCLRSRDKKFATKVVQAQAQARLKAEMMAHEEDPRLWLRSGPGKESKDNPGWTAIVRPQINDNRTINLFGSPDFIQFMATLRAALAPFPEALKALADALDSKPKLIAHHLEPKQESVPTQE